MLAELRHLWRNHRLTIRLEGIAREVFLMVVLCDEEHIQFGHFGHDGTVPDLLSVQALDKFFGNLLLLIIVIKDRGTILRTRVCALTVQGGGIVDHEENI